MPNTDREHLKALVGGLDLWHQFGAELPVDKAYKDAKHHTASTPDAGSDGAAGLWPRVKGRCPACGNDGTLFLANGGYVTCGWIECPDPLAAIPTPTPSPPIPDNIEPSDWKCSDNANCDGKCCDTPDTGGVEGPRFYAEGRYVCDRQLIPIRAKMLAANEWEARAFVQTANELVEAANAAYYSGHLDGARSGVAAYVDTQYDLRHHSAAPEGPKPTGTIFELDLFAREGLDRIISAKESAGFESVADQIRVIQTNLLPLIDNCMKQYGGLVGDAKALEEFIVACREADDPASDTSILDGVLVRIPQMIGRSNFAPTQEPNPASPAELIEGMSDALENLSIRPTEGHKAGASGSGEAAKEIKIGLCEGCEPITPHELHALYSITGDHPAADEVVASVRKKLSHTLGDLPEGAVSDEYKDYWVADHFATQNPASGSDGLRARVEKVLELVEDYGRKLDKGGGEHRMYLRQFIQKELPHKLAAALADGGMGDE